MERYSKLSSRGCVGVASKWSAYVCVCWPDLARRKGKGRPLPSLSLAGSVLPRRQSAPPERTGKNEETKKKSRRYGW